MIILLSLFAIACSNAGIGVQEVTTVDSISYARYISISEAKDYINVEIRNPWDSTKLLQRYALVHRDKKIPQGVSPTATVVRVPIKRCVVYNSVHASIIEMLGAGESIVGACEVQYIDSKELRTRISQGIVADVGESTSPNIEKIIDSHAEAIMSSPFKDTGYGAASKLKIPIIEGADYMESHPLGRVEWIKFYGLLFGERERADSIFEASATEYLRLKELASHVEKRPTVIAEKRYGSVWFVPGGQSYNATLFADAGGDYIFASTTSSGSIPLSFESVLNQGIDADVWVMKYNNPHNNMSYDDLRSEYEPYANFRAFKERRVYGCNTSHKRYYQDIPMFPHLLLKEYIHILHPQLLHDFTPHYFEAID